MASNISGVGDVFNSAAQGPSGNALRELGVDEFLKMMIAELQNQDPMDPMDNAQMLEQISRIRDIVSNDRLTETLEAAFLGQNIATAGNMMGQWVVAASENDGSVLAAGQVEKVLIEDGVPRLYVRGESGNRILKLDDISQIQSPGQGEQLAALMDMIGQTVTAVTDATAGQLSQVVTGTVTRVSISGDGLYKFHVMHDPDDEKGVEYTVDPSNVAVDA